MQALKKLSESVKLLQSACSLTHPYFHRGHMTCFVTSKNCQRVKKNASSLAWICRTYYTANDSSNRIYNADCTVDFRSDTVTKPTPEMRQAMFEAEVGDDVMEEDPTINKLQDRVAALFNKEAALFVPSGSMGNLICAMCHCQGKLDEIILGSKCHMLLWEQGSFSTIGGIGSRQVQQKDDGTFSIEEAESMIRKADVHMPKTKLICLENTQNQCGGRVVPLSFMKEVRDLADRRGIKVHLDGARVLNAAAALGVEPAEIGQYVDSLSVCFSKGLGSPVGSAVVGTREFIEDAKRVRKALGGGMRQAGVLAACALVSLDKIAPRLHEDHANAKKLANGLQDMNSPVFTVNPSVTDSNMVLIHIKGGVNIMEVIKMLMIIHENEKETIGSTVKVQIFPLTMTSLRAVTHHHISSEDIGKALKKFKLVSDLIENKSS